MGFKWEDSNFNEYPLTCFKIQLRTEEIILRPIEFLKCKKGKTLQDRKFFGRESDN